MSEDVGMDKCPRCGRAVEVATELGKVFRHAYHCPNCNAYYYGGEAATDPIPSRSQQ